MSTVTSTATPISVTLAKRINGFGYADLPPLAIEHAQMMIASTLASAAAGRNIRSSAVVRTLAKEQGGVPEASIWF